MSNNADRMKTIREEWADVGFKQVNMLVHAFDRDIIEGFVTVARADRILTILNDKTDPDAALALAFMLERRNHIRDALTHSEVIRWLQDNERVMRKSSAAVAEIQADLTRAMDARRARQNAAAHIATQGKSVEKYEEAVRGAAFGYAYTLRAMGNFALLKLGVNVKARRNG